MFKQISTAVDGSENSLTALETAAHLAAQENAILQIISIIEPLPIFLAGTHSSSLNETHIESWHQIYKKLHQDQRKQLGETYPHLKTISTIKTGRPATLIKETTLDSDLIVIGHRGNSRLDSMILGSVAKELLDQCTAPVLVVKTCKI